MRGGEGKKVEDGETYRFGAIEWEQFSTVVLPKQVSRTKYTVTFEITDPEWEDTDEETLIHNLHVETKIFGAEEFNYTKETI